MITKTDLIKTIAKEENFTVSAVTKIIDKAAEIIVTINLPMLALEAKGDVIEFFKLFEHYIQLSHDYLLLRLKTIEQKKAYNFPFLMGQGVWLDSDKLKPDDSIKDVLKHASYSIGFCGLAECLVALLFSLQSTDSLFLYSLQSNKS